MNRATELQKFARSYNWIRGVIQGWSGLLDGYGYAGPHTIPYLTDRQIVAWNAARTAVAQLARELADYDGARAIYDKKHEIDEA